jgi:hypothetical protein
MTDDATIASNAVVWLQDVVYRLVGVAATVTETTVILIKEFNLLPT